MSDAISLFSPVKKVFVTQVFGVNPESYARFGLKGHNGIDFRAFLPNGERCYSGGQSEVFAPHDGKCLENALDTNGYGWYIKIESGTQGSTLAHLSSQSPIKVGQTVKAGQFVGFQGTTGNSTGLHLHWGWYPIPRNRSNGFNGYENQAGKYKPYQEETMTTELEACMADRKKFWQERDEWKSKYENEVQAHKQTALDLMECQKSGLVTKIEPELQIAGRVWELNGLQVSSNGVVTGNYRIK